MRKVRENVDAHKVYSLPEAVALVKKNATAKFDETVEIAINVGIDPSKSDQRVRGIAQLPHGNGKTYRVAVFAQGAQAADAKTAGADIVGAEDLIEAIQRGEMNFERCVATPDMMALVGRVAKILGPRGLMPSPKAGTVSVNVAAAVKAVKGGQIEFRTEKGGVIHAGVGKASFAEAALEENIRFLVDIVQKEKPATAKGTFLKKMTLSSTMGAGVTFLV
ncbi:50S ribosomal protein L1 [Alphaproteobacteria bacterium]|nr:50S ribosomal protein L1 [Alphaproteobacteria bacterium]GHS95567.1 50S ribosomal protein L1 [Alphaproteobacteria bacterium]